MGVIQNAAITGRDDLLRMCLQRARGFPTWNFGKLEAVLLDAVNGAIRAAQTEVINTLYEFWTNHWNPTKRYPFGTWLRLVAQCGSVETAQVVVPIAMAHGVSRYLLANEACKSNSADIIRYMLDKNLLSAESSLGSYTLRQAVVFGNREIARELIYRGANIKGSGLGASLTHTCFQRYNPSMLLFLIGWKCVLSPWTLRAAEREMSEMQIWPYPGRQNIQRKLCYYIIAKTRRTAAPSAWYIDCSELDAFTRRMDRDKGWKVLVEGLVKSWDSLKHPV
ncbi:hypothetical protein P154DRAFT_525664 [Amniculicola lignicola CBS 123094]|uniref:Ankyrin n=1 Tax=Amniculicola lignicola CBS 123094 TaxID=1392246 RepID=A0A6A5W3G1_9PLEO|nr:hypothetical protein P154DRAFT_525664 [Amniculicola lignicola CBS 123094]